MANRKGLGVSKKYANGTIHETATGKFIVLDRFVEEDDENSNAILEFQWMSGDREGKIETNREMNIAANIHKFQTSRGIPTVASEPQRIEHNVPFMEKIDLMQNQLMYNAQILDTFKTQISSLDLKFNTMLSLQEQQFQMIEALTKRVEDLTERNVELMSKQQDSMTKLIDKI